MAWVPSVRGETRASLPAADLNLDGIVSGAVPAPHSPRHQRWGTDAYREPTLS